MHQSATKKSHHHHHKSGHKHTHSNTGKHDYFDELSSQAKSKLGQLLLTVAEEELFIEKIRQQLSSIKEFECWAAFTRIDRDKKNFIMGKDIAIFIK